MKPIIGNQKQNKTITEADCLALMLVNKIHDFVLFMMQFFFAVRVIERQKKRNLHCALQT